MEDAHAKQLVVWLALILNFLVESYGRCLSETDLLLGVRTGSFRY
jgi:hypothetical protein